VAGVRVRGFDPAARSAADGVEVVATPAEAARGADVVVSVNSAAAAAAAATSVLAQLRAEQLFADLNTAAPARKREVAAVVAPTGALFVDVALLGSVPERGLRTPALASGPGAGRFAAVFASRGMPVTVLGAEPGEAAGRKLVRSVFAKGLAAAMDEALAAAEGLGCGPWLRGDIERTIAEADASLVARFLDGSRVHAVRRTEEMAAARELLTALGVEPRIASAAEAWLRELQSARGGGQ
jgi:3-hydroxyisobutyrate dehydrogenase-like beta-hydroxyacid dehydrogenase